MQLGKTIVIAAAALLLGIFIGGIGPRSELQKTQAALKDAEARGQQGNAAALPLALGLGSLAAARAQADRATPPGAGVPRFVPPDPNDVGPADDGAGRNESHDRAHAGDTRADGGAEKRRRLTTETLRAAKTAADLRAAQFRAAFLEEAKLSPASAAAVDATVKSMNQELARAADEIAQTLGAQREKSQKLAPRDMADIGARVLDIYRRADDQFKASLDENGRAAAQKTDFDLLTQIDVGAFERLGQTLETLDPPRFAPQ